jgi:hypothetical protein
VKLFSSIDLRADWRKFQNSQEKVFDRVFLASFRERCEGICISSYIIIIVIVIIHQSYAENFDGGKRARDGFTIECSSVLKKMWQVVTFRIENIAVITVQM